ncbi:MAG: hypothetical protein HWD61_12980 [Parachlamydiaceae bacterium]|nr:MAG: hypothetical protein HWD61_12980 [Parachlamydiaceae bacterium]
MYTFGLGAEISKKFFSPHKNPHSPDKAIYNCSFQPNVDTDWSRDPNPVSWTSAFISVENNQFKISKSMDEDCYFDNFDQVLRYLFKGDFSQGELFRADYYIFRRADGAEIRYDNPFRS